MIIPNLTSKVLQKLIVHRKDWTISPKFILDILLYEQNK